MPLPAPLLRSSPLLLALLLADGMLREFYENGTLKREALFKAGRLEGVNRWFHDNGKPASEQAFANDEATGKKIAYDRNGKRVK